MFVMSDKEAMSGEGKRRSGNKDVRLGFHVPADLLASYEAWKQSFELPPTDSDALRLFLREAMTKRGYWPLKKDQEPTANGSGEKGQ